MQMNEKNLYIPIEMILRNYGSVEAINPVRIARIYQDDKVRITGFIERQGVYYERFSIQLLLKSETSGLAKGQETSFGIPKSSKENDFTLVFWCKVLDEHKMTTWNWIRPGRWLSYLGKLCDDIIKESAYLDSLDKNPIDDSKIFPNLTYPSTE
jgi:hypothetical protein